MLMLPNQFIALLVAEVTSEKYSINSAEPLIYLIYIYISPAFLALVQAASNKSGKNTVIQTL